MTVRLRRDCRLCQGEGLLPLRGRPKAMLSALQRTIRAAMGIDADAPPRRFACQVCDSGEVLPLDLACDPDVY